MSYAMRRSFISVVLLFAAIFAGLLLHHEWRHLSWGEYKYGHSVFWALAVYWLIAAVLPRYGSRVIAPVAALIALLVELSRLVHTPAFDAFRITLPGRLLLGRFFSVKDIAAYWFAIALAALADDLLTTRFTRQ